MKDPKSSSAPNGVFLPLKDKVTPGRVTASLSGIIWFACAKRSPWAISIGPVLAKGTADPISAYACKVPISCS